MPTVSNKTKKAPVIANKSGTNRTKSGPTVSVTNKKETVAPQAKKVIGHECEDGVCKIIWG